MNIFIKRLPRSITRKELNLFVEQTLNSGWRNLFRGRDKVNACEIVRVARRDIGSVQSYGMVKVKHPKTALTLLKKLNGASLNGTKIEAVRYVQRSTLRDRRSPSMLLDNRYLTNDRRHGDRRHARVLIERGDSLVVEGLDRFRRIHG